MLQHEVRVKGRQIGTESVSGRTMLGRILKLATENSWEVRVGESEYYSGDVYVKSTDTVRPGELKKHQWLQGIKHGHGFLWSKDHAILDGKRVNNDELRIALEEL